MSVDSHYLLSIVVLLMTRLTIALVAAAIFALFYFGDESRSIQGYLRAAERQFGFALSRQVQIAAAKDREQTPPQ